MDEQNCNETGPFIHVVQCLLGELLHFKLAVSIGPGVRCPYVPMARFLGLLSKAVYVCKGIGRSRIGRFVIVVERPEQREGQRHSQDLRHSYRHAQEAKNLQLLRASDETVYLGTAALESEQKWPFKIPVCKKKLLKCEGKQCIWYLYPSGQLRHGDIYKNGIAMEDWD